jgi:hypothetical protein
MEIGDPERTFTVEPVEDPVPRELPAEPAQQPARPSPAEQPIKPEKVPAPSAQYPITWSQSSAGARGS